MYEMVKKVLNDGMSYEQAALRHGVSERTVRRKVDAYLKLGASALIHRSRGRKAFNRLPEGTEDMIVGLYEKKYAGYNFTHFLQKLAEREGITVAYSTLYRTLETCGHRSPKAQRLRGQDSLHPIRQRRCGFGELVQMDASVHNWFSDITCNLHLAIDDATSAVLGAHFAKQETLRGYFRVFAQIIDAYGVPEEFYTDRRSVFCSKNTKSARLEDDAGTQFRMAAAKLGVVEIHVSSVPQAKGRVERCFQTLQDRLISEMRTARIASIDEANAFLPAFIADHNARYAKDKSSIPNVFADGPLNEQEVNIALSVVCERIVQKGSYVSHKAVAYTPTDGRKRVLIKGGEKVFLLHSLDDNIYMVHGDKILPLVRFDTLELPHPKDLQGSVYIPPKDHPWKESSYKMMLKRLRKAA